LILVLEVRKSDQEEEQECTGKALKNVKHWASAKLNLEGNRPGFQIVLMIKNMIEKFFPLMLEYQSW